jgi:hypothetical protein
MKYIIRNEEIRHIVLQEIGRLNLDKPWEVRFEPYHPRRSLDQNAFLHAVPLQLIAEHTGFNKDELRDYLLMEAFGTNEKEVLGRTIVRPVKSSSQLTTKEFNWFLEWIEAWASHTLGLLIPKPNEEIT